MDGEEVSGKVKMGKIEGGSMSGNKKCAFAVYSMGEKFDGYKKNLIRGLKRHVPGVDVVEIKETQFDIFNILNGEDRPYFMRMAIPLMSDMQKYDRVIWLDVDIDILSDKFAGILDVETSDDGLAAASDMDNQQRIEAIKKQCPEYDRPVYFNSGVMVFDLWKIDTESWKKRAGEGIKRWAKGGFIMHDQDVFNFTFDIREINSAYNSIWRVHKDGDYCIHYCDNEGKRLLDEKMAKRNAWMERCIVVAPRHDFIRPWIRAYFASGNTIPLVIVPGPPGDWKEGDMEYCLAAAEYSGGLILDCSSEWQDAMRLSKRAARSKGGTPVGWYSKKYILHAAATKLAPKEWAWIDDDAEITGRLDECFARARNAPGFIFTQFYYPLQNPKIDYSRSRHPLKMFKWPISDGEKLCWNSLVFFHGDANERLKDLANDFPVEDDEIIFWHLYENDPKWNDGFCDFSMHNWQATCKKLKDIPSRWSGKILHYTGRDNNGECKKMWAAKAYSLPRAPFERSEEGIAQTDPVDAVFVIGTGSHSNNEELRYALRNLCEHCKFVRDVYICGECPSWIDKTMVRHLQWPDRFTHAKDANIIDKLRHACEFPGIAKRILFCSDDQFQTRECKWDDFKPRYLRRYASGDTWYADMHRVWHTRLRKTLEREVQRRKSIGMSSNDIYYWQPHIWMPIDRDAFIDYAKWCGYERRDDTIIASGYYNFVYTRGVKDFDHVFLDGDQTSVPKETHVAYHDGSCSAALKLLKYMFPEKCVFEVGWTGQKSGVQNEMPTGANMDPSPATDVEMRRITMSIDGIKSDKEWDGLLSEVSRAEELRIFCVKGWRTVWNDIIERWESATPAPRSDAASKILDAYSSNPMAMRTSRFNKNAEAKPSPDVRNPGMMRTSIRDALRRRTGNGIL